MVVCKFNKIIPYFSYFCSVTEKDWLIIVNPHAGSGKTLSEWSAMQAELDRLQLPYRCVHTEHKGHAAELACEAAEAGCRHFLAVGGDGSVHELFNGILRWCEQQGTDPAEFVLGVAPIGSGNDWLRSLGVPCDIGHVLSLAASGSIGRQDVVRLQDGDGLVFYMANIGGVGFDSHVCETVNREKERGHRSRLIYLWGLLRTIHTVRSIRVRIQADGQEVFSGACYSIALGCGSYSGGGMRQVPLARPDDGLIDALIVPVMPLWRILTQIPRLFTGSIHRSPDIRYVQAARLEIEPLDEASRDIIETDGEVEGRLPLSVSVTGLKTGIIC